MDTDAVVEGTTREPVVTGIGTGSPRRLGAPPSQLAPAPTALSAPAADADPAEPEPEPQFAFNARPLNPATPAASSQVPRAAPLAPPQAAPMSASALACRQALRRLGVRFTELPAISHGRSCGIAHPIRVTELSGGIRIRPAATLNCPVTLEFAKWIKDEVAPAARARYLSGIESIHQLSSYSCRTMNSQKGAPMSEHAHGNAIDIGSFTLNSGRTVDVRKPGLFAFRQRGFLNTVRADSCGYFNTVLGPGSNKYHWNHFHFDLRQRKSGRSYCE